MSKISSEPVSPFAAAVPPPGAEGIRDSLRGKHVCPFCGSVNDSDQGTCPRCTMENSAATRKATKTRIGPWYVLQTRNPAAPGMTWETLVGFVRKGRVKPRSIVRGPTTHQLWRFAAHVKGLSREFGICYSCGASVEAAASVCRTCNRLQDPPPNPDALLETSREAAGPGAYAGPPPTITGTVPQTVVDTVVAEVPPAVPPPPPPEDAEFVIPPFDGGGVGYNGGPGLNGGGNGSPFNAAAVNGGGANGTTGNGPAAGQPVYQGISGDASWARIPGGPRDRNGGFDRNGGPDRNGPGGWSANGVPASPQAGGRGTPGRGANGVAPAAPGARFNPYDADDEAANGTGPANRRGDGDAGFLSPKELAAAFNLSFVGEDEEEPVYQTVRPGAGNRGPAGGGRTPVPASRPGPAATPNPRVNPAASSAAAAAAMASSFAGGGGPQSPAGTAYRPAGTRPRRGFLKFVVALLFLGGAGLGVAMAVSADFRKTAREWFNKVTAELNKAGANDQLGSPGSTRDKPKRGAEPRFIDPDRLDGGADPADAARSNSATPPETQPAGGAAASSPGATAGAQGTAASGAAGGDERPTGGKPAAGAPPTGPSANAAKGTGPKASGAAAGKSPAGTPSGLTAEAWRSTEAYKLYTQAITEEANDPAIALARYKSIKRLPKDTWPNDIDGRIEKAERELRKRLSE